VLDVPDAPELLAVFIARAVVDDVLPPAAAHRLAGGVGVQWPQRTRAAGVWCCLMLHKACLMQLGNAVLQQRTGVRSCTVRGAAGDSLGAL
jgi:hypothetical protein